MMTENEVNDRGLGAPRGGCFAIIIYAVFAVIIAIGVSLVV